MKFHLWFDPTSAFHHYAIIWNPDEIMYDPSTDSYHDNMEGNGILCLTADILFSEFSKEISRDWEAEMQRLKLELKQTMDMYSIACKEAISAKQKAKELHEWKTLCGDKIKGGGGEAKCWFMCVCVFVYNMYLLCCIRTASMYVYIKTW